MLLVFEVKWVSYEVILLQVSLVSLKELHLHIPDPLCLWHNFLLIDTGWMWGYLQVETLCLWGWESVKIILSTKKVWEMETVAQKRKSQTSLTSLWSQLHFSRLFPSSEIALCICILSWCLIAGGISFGSSYSFTSTWLWVRHCCLPEPQKGPEAPRKT